MALSFVSLDSDFFFQFRSSLKFFRFNIQNFSFAWNDSYFSSTTLGCTLYGMMPVKDIIF